MQVGTRNDSIMIQAQIPAVIAALNQGYYVSIADDTGVHAAFC
jgi:hypothetical protein